MIDPVTRWILSACAGLALLVLLWMHGYHRGQSAEERAHEVTKREHAVVIERLADLTRIAADKARAATAAVAIERADLDDSHEKALTDAKLEADRLRADLRAGRRELQDWWACPVPGAGSGDAAADGDKADATRRADSAARIAEAVAVDAAVIERLWGSWQADRRAVIDAGCAVAGP